MCYYSYNNILILFILLVLSIFGNYMVEFLELKKFTKEFYNIDINFLSFTYNLILKKIRAIF